MVPPVSESRITDAPILHSPVKKGIKRRKCPEKWKRNVQKKLRNAGKMYEKHAKGKPIRAEKKLNRLVMKNAD